MSLEKLYFPEVDFDEYNHRYSYKGQPYISVSKLLSLITPVFEREKMASFTAAKEGITVQEVLERWDRITREAQDHGKLIHKHLEDYSNLAKRPEDPVMEAVCIGIHSLFSNHKKTFDEARLWSHHFKVAGTTDKCLFRNTNENIIDIRDYKTNKSKGIEYFSKYNKTLLYPMHYLEDCNYIKYALQMSLYGLMLEEMFGNTARIGNLALIFIPPDDPMNWYEIPVPYMRYEAWGLMEWYRTEHLLKRG